MLQLMGYVRDRCSCKNRPHPCYSGLPLERVPSGPTRGTRECQLRQCPGDCLSDPSVGARFVATTELVVGLRIIHTPREVRERGKGMIEGDALDIGGNARTTLIRFKDRVPKRCRLGM